MWFSVLLLLVGTFRSEGSVEGPPPDDGPPGIDCGLRELVFRQSTELLPVGANLQSVFDALQLHDCNGHPPKPVVSHIGQKEGSCHVKDPAPLQVWVSTSGSDSSGDGSMPAPFATLSHARDVLRVQRTSALPARSRADVLIRGGVYTMEAALELGVLDSDTRFIACPGEKVVLSGGVRLPALQFTRSAGQIFSATLPHPVHGVDQLFVLHGDDDMVGTRLVWAREPNGNAETDLQPQGYALAAGNPLGNKPPPPGAGPYIPLQAPTPTRNNSWFPAFGIDKDPRGGSDTVHLHSGGEAAVYQDHRDFWNQMLPAGLRWNTTGGMTKHGYVQAFNAEGWPVVQDMPKPLLHCMHIAEWGNHIWEVDRTDLESHTFHLGKGGWQEGRISGIGTNPFYVEGARAALNHPGEWWLDEDAGTLWIIPNKTISGADTFALDLVVPLIPVLVNVSGAGTAQASRITLSGLTFAHTTRTLLKRYLVPSPGDWSVHAGGVVQATRSKAIVVEGCSFNRTGGNAVAFVGGVESGVISNNEVELVGDSAFVLVGRLPGIGNNGTKTKGELPDYPEGTLIQGNHIHDIGIWGKQVSALFQAVACNTTFTRNVAYNGPRAGVNFNDGFCGGHSISKNVLFNWVRETQDHGPINTWDRAAYLQPHGGLYPKWNRIVRNLIMNGPSGNRGLGNLFPTVDNDDGSAYYWVAENVVAYGGFKNFLGNDKVWIHNLILYPGGRTASSGNGPCVMAWGGPNEVYQNNTCVTRGTAGPGVSPYPAPDDTCSYKGPNRSVLLNLAQNRYWTPSEDYQVGCGGGLNLSEMQALGQELGSQVGPSPPASELIRQAEQILGMPSRLPTVHIV